jgi:hypothetical protein
MIAVAFFTLEAARQAPKTLWFVRNLEANLPLDFVDHQVLPGAKFQPFAQLFRNDDLKFRGNPDGLQVLILYAYYPY